MQRQRQGQKPQMLISNFYFVTETPLENRYFRMSVIIITLSLLYMFSGSVQMEQFSLLVTQFTHPKCSQPSSQSHQPRYDGTRIILVPIVFSLSLFQIFLLASPVWRQKTKNILCVLCHSYRMNEMCHLNMYTLPGH